MIGSGRSEYDVVVQSQTESLFQYLLLNEQKKDIILTAPILVDDEVVNVNVGHGFVGQGAAPGEHIVVRKGDAFFQLKTTTVSINAISVESPIDMPFPISGTSVMRGNSLMNVDGVASETDFEFTFNGDTTAQVPIDIGTVIITMQHGANVPDDGKFGGLGALAKGLYIRKVNGENFGLGNYTSNQEFKNVGGVVEYTDKAPAGTNATNITIEIEKVFGKVIRLDPKTLDSVISMVRDDIDATEGMELMTLSILGSFTSGE